jgi:Arc/MetJ family transcription regulator
MRLDGRLIQRARRLARTKTKKSIVNKPLETSMRAGGRKGILCHFASGIWKGDLKSMRQNRVLPSVKGSGRRPAGGGRNAR